MAGEDDTQSKTLVAAPGMARRFADAPRARLVCSNPKALAGGEGAEILLDGAEMTIGRGTENRVVLSAESISRRHARVFPFDDGWHIEDTGSTNGIRVNGQDVADAELKDGDSVEIGDVPYAFRIDVQEEKDADRPTLEFASGIPGLRPERHTGGASSGSMGANALLWSIVLVGAGALIFAIFTVISV